jgi:hypothetical protein
VFAKWVAHVGSHHEASSRIGYQDGVGPDSKDSFKG